MSRKDYELIARVFIARREKLAPQLRWLGDDLAGDMADALKADNSAFDRGRFLKACGVGA